MYELPGDDEKCNCSPVEVGHIVKGRIDGQEERILEMYNSVPEYIRESIYEASNWARNYMTNLEGSGHEFYITAGRDSMVVCSFAKPEWGGDHSSRGMDHGAQAMVMAVCEYVNGA